MTYYYCSCRVTRLLIRVANTAFTVIVVALVVIEVIIQISWGFIVTGVTKRTGRGFG